MNMKEHLFFNIEGNLEYVADKIFESLGAKNNLQIGESAHVIDNVYYSFSIFGIEIKLEKNGYDYERDYDYMISIGKDFLSNLEVVDIILTNATDIVINLLTTNLKIEIAYEVDENNIKIYKPN